MAPLTPMQVSQKIRDMEQRLAAIERALRVSPRAVNEENPSRPPEPPDRPADDASEADDAGIEPVDDGDPEGGG